MFPAPSELLPHGGLAVLLDRVLSHEPGQTTCAARVDPAHPYLRDGRLEAAIALELLAQTVAVHGRLSAAGASGGSPARGYVVGAQRIDFQGGDYLVGDELEIEVRPLFHQGALSKFEGTVRADGALRARGDLSVFVEPPSDARDAEPSDAKGDGTAGAGGEA